jgi:hypothetical protein
MQCHQRIRRWGCFRVSFYCQKIAMIPPRPSTKFQRACDKIEGVAWIRRCAGPRMPCEKRKGAIDRPFCFRTRLSAPLARPLANDLDLARTSGTTSSCNDRTRGAAYETTLRRPLPSSSQSFLCHISPRHAVSTSSAHGLAPSPIRTPTTTVHFHSSILHCKMPPSRRKHRRP